VKNSFLSFVGWTLTGFGLGIALMSLVLLLFGYSAHQIHDPNLAHTTAAALALGWANVGFQFGAFVFPSFIFYWLQRHSWTSPWKTLPPLPIMALGAISLLIGAGFIDLLSVINLKILETSPSLAQWAHSGETVQTELQKALMNQPQGSGILQVIIIIALVPAVFEEYFFRGALFHWLLQWLSPWKVMVITGFIFSLIHFQFEGFLSRWFMGVFLGFLAYQSQSLWPSILAHFFNNLSGIFLYYHFQGSMTAPEGHWMNSPIWWGISTVLMIGLVLWIRKVSRNRTVPI
jgi:hypothetical protein